MARITHLAVIGTAALITLPALGACVYPDEIGAPPDGATATEEEMIQGQQTVKTWMADMEKFLECLNTEREALGEEINEEQQVANDKSHNTAVDAMNEVAARFNEQIREYKAANN